MIMWTKAGIRETTDVQTHFVGMHAFLGLREKTFDMPKEEFIAAWDKWQGGAMIQDAFQTLPDRERGWLLDGYYMDEEMPRPKHPLIDLLEGMLGAPGDHDCEKCDAKYHCKDEKTPYRKDQKQPEEPTDEDLSGVVKTGSEEIGGKVEEPPEITADDLVPDAERPEHEEQFKSAQDMIGGEL